MTTTTPAMRADMRDRFPGPLHRALLLPAAAALALSGCTPAAESSGTTDGVSVLASFYPLQYVAEQVGKENISVSSVTPPGAEPHNLELSPAKVAELADADLVVYASGFQPAVDDAVAQAAPASAVDVADAAGLAAPGGTADPHFWLDPTRLADVARVVAQQLGETDPDNAAAYEANAGDLSAELAALDAEYRSGLAVCERRTVVVAHEAYGYLAERYGLEQAGVSGIDPESEPAPARVAKIRRVIESQDVSTIFTESLVNPKVARTLAADLGVETALLDPLETHAGSGGEYPEVMRSNLAALRKGLDCA